MSVKCTAIVIFLIYDQFGTIRKPNSRRIVCKNYIFINSNLIVILLKLKTELKKLWHNSHTIALSKGTIFPKKCKFFAKEMLTSAKFRESWY